jgi:hypothetical protein
MQDAPAREAGNLTTRIRDIFRPWQARKENTISGAVHRAAWVVFHKPAPGFARYQPELTVSTSAGTLL